MVSRVADSVFIPFTVGGGIRSVEDAGRVLRAGADKIAVNTALVREPALTERLAACYGRQCVVAAVDVRRIDGGWQVMVTGGHEPTPLEAVGWCAELSRLGAGEILLTSMDRDGTRQGYDLALLQAVSHAVSIPVIASGGAGTLADLAAGLEAGAHGVLVASIFHDRGASLTEARDYLRTRGFPVRP